MQNHLRRIAALLLAFLMAFSPLFENVRVNASEDVDSSVTDESSDETTLREGTADEASDTNEANSEDDGTFTVTFYDRDADVYQTIKVAKGSAIGDQLPAAITREDYNAYWAIGTIVDGAQGTEISVTKPVKIVNAETTVSADMTVVPYYEKITHTVTFYKEDKTTEVTAKTVDVDTSYCLNDIPSVPTKTGYSGKWVYERGDFSNTVTITEDTSVWAEYTQQVFTVTFISDGKDYQTDTYYDGDTLSLPNAPVVEGKEFVKWVDENGTEYEGGETVTSDLTLTAVFDDMLYVNFVILNDDGTVSERLSQYFRTKGEAIGTMPQDPFVAGKTFEKWVIEGTDTEVTADTVVTDNMTVVAQFHTLAVYTITAEYFYKNDNGNDVIFNTDIIQVEEKDLPYTVTAPESTQTDSEEVAEGLIYYAETQSVEVTKDNFADGNEYKVRIEYVEYTATYDFVYMLKNLNGEGYTEFDREAGVKGVLGSYVTPTAKTYDYAIVESVEGATITQASGQELKVYYTRKSFSLSYETNGGSYVAGGTYAYGTSVTLPTTATRSGYTFAGWYSDEELTESVTGSVTIEEDTILYAKWNGASVNYTIVYLFEKYDDTGSTTSYVYDNSRDASGTVGSTVQAANAPTITRTGWEKDTAKNATSSVVIAADGSSVLNVYYKLTEYTLVFDRNHKNRHDDYIVKPDDSTTTSTYSIKVKLGQDISSLWPSADCDDCYFVGWTKGGTSGTKFVTKQLIMNSDLVPTNGTSVTWYASWTDKATRRTVNYYLQNADNDGYTKSETYSQTYNTTGNSTLNPKAINGYTYDHSADSGNTYNFYYNRNTYNIDYYYGSENLKTISKVKFDANITGNTYNWTPTAAESGVDSDYTFEGWFSDSGLTTKYTFSTMPASNLVLYAKWTAPTYTVSFVDTDGTTPLADDQPVVKYEKATRPTDPIKAGYVFDGWYTSADGDTLYDWNNQITEDTTVYAHWTQATLSYTVRYVDEEGNDVATAKEVSNPTYIIGQTVTESAIAVTGYRPDATSKELKLAAENNVITFVYSKKTEKTSYTVQYFLDPEEYPGNIEVVATKTVTADGNITDVVEMAAAVDYDTLYEDHPELKGIEFYPDESQKSLVLSSDVLKNVITFYYSSYKNAKVTVHYVDMEGNAIASDNTERLKVGKTFTLSRTPIAGWEFYNAVEGSVEDSTYSDEAAATDYKITSELTEKGLEFTLYYQKRMTITVNSASKQYDGTALTLPTELSDQVTIDGLTDDDRYVYTLASIEYDYSNNDVENGRLNAGVAKVTPKNAVFNKVKRAADRDLDMYYKIRYIAGTLEVTQINVTVRIEPDRWTGATYTGTEYKTGFTNPSKDVADYILISHEGYAKEYLDAIWNTVKTKATEDSTAAGLGYYVLAEKNVGDYTYNLDFTVGDLPKDSNYSVNLYVRPGRLQILPVDLTVTTGSATKTYDGTELTNEEATLAGVVEADEEKITVTATGSQTVVGSSNNTYTINWGGVSSDNYNVKEELGTLEVKKATLTVTVNDKSVLYNGSAQSGYTIASVTGTGEDVSTDDYTVTGLAKGEVLTITYTPATGTDAGTYENGEFDETTISIKAKDADVTENYEIGTLTAGKLTITKRSVTLTSADDEKVYDGTALTNKNVTVSGDGFVDGEGATYDVTGTQTDVGSSKNTFTYTLNSNTKAANYDITPVEGTLTVTGLTDKVTVTITENSGSEKYDGSEKTVTGYTVSIDNKLYTEADFKFAGNATVKGTDAGTYNMELKAADFTNNNKNFTNVEFVIVDGTLEISKRTVTLTSADDEKTYDGTALTNDEVTVGGDGFATGEGATYDVTGTQTDAGSSANAFTYTLNSNTKADNYTITKTEGTLTVNAITDKVTVTITEHSGNEKYDGAEKTVTGYDVSIDNKLYTEKDFSFTGNDTVKGTDAGSYDMELKAADFTNTSKNFTNVEFKIVDGKLEIAKRTVTLTSATDSKTYDGTALTNDTVTVSGDGFAEGEGATYDVTGTQTEKGSSANTFTYTLNSNTKAANYDITPVEGTLTVTEFTDKVVVTITEHSGSEKYDGSEKTVTGYDVSINNELYTEADFTFSGNATVKGTDAGSYDMELKAADFTNNSKNFTDVEFVIVDGKLEISKRTVTLTSADDEKVYDGTVLTNDTVTVTGDGFATGEGATYTVTGKQTDVGSSANAFTYTLNSNTKADNYTITKTEGTLTVTAMTDKVTVTITEHSGSEKYDGSEKTVTGYDVSIDNKLYTENDFTFSGNATVKGTDAGSYDMELTADDFENISENITNVEFVIVDGKLEISKRTVTLTSADDEKIYDGTALTNDEVTVSGDGFVDGEGATYDVTGTQTEKGSSKNTFTYTLNDGTKADNYTITTVEGTLTVTAVTDKVTVTITEHSGSEKYDGTEKTVKGYDVSISNKLYTEDDFTFSGDATVKGTDAGTYNMELKTSDFTNNSTNFSNVEFVIVDGTLEISKREVTLTSATDKKVYDGEALTNDEVTVSGNGFAEGEGAKYDVTGTQTLVGSSDNAFTYTLNEGTKAANYTISVVLGTLTVTDGSGEDEEPVDDDLVVTKSHEEGEFGLGDTVTFTITATNIYEDARTITLEEIDGVTLAEDTFENVAGGETIETTATYTITEADILAGEFENTVTAKVGNIEKKATDTVTADEIEDKDGHLTITKETTSETPEDGYALGDTITYKITVENDGNLTITDITVTDELTKDEWTVDSLAPGESKEFDAKYTVTEDDILAGEVVNVATGTGKSPDPEKPDVPVEPGEDPEPTEDPNGHLTVVKETTSETPEDGYALGDTVSYKITVTNDGNLTITDITVTDERTSGEWEIESLAPGESKEYTTSTTVTEEDVLSGHILNEATAEGTSPDPDKPDVPVTPGTTDDEPEDKDGHLTVEKITTSEPENGEAYALGETISYKITVKNDGNLTITDITVTDELTEDEWEIESLAPGESKEFEAEYEVTEDDVLAGEVVNVATAEGTSPDPDDPKVPVVPGEDPEPTEDPDGHLTITKETTSEPENGKTYALGETITYEITVTNDGNLTITDIKVTDELTGDEWTIKSLAPGAEEKFDAEYVVTEEDVLAGSVVNVATAEGKSPDPDEPKVPVIPGEDPEPTDSPNGHLTIEKKTTSKPANGKDYAFGETITYEITVKNDGNLTITDIEVTDELTGDKWTIDSMEPDETKTFEAKYVVAEEDIIAGSVRNEATGTGTSPDPENPKTPVTPGVDTQPTEDPVKLTITADSFTIDYGDPEPKLTVKGEGFINGEDLSKIEYTITREPGTAAGTYKITVTGEAQQGHYLITYVDGTLTIVPATYEYTKGMGQHWKKGSTTTADFEVTRSVHDERAFGYYLDMEIDGVKVDKSQYRYEEGCVEQYISAEFLQTLSVGEHELKAIFEDGEATTNFFIDEEDKPAPKPNVPDTGDRSNVGLWLAMMLASAAGITTIGVASKKRKSAK